MSLEYIAGLVFTFIALLVLGIYNIKSADRQEMDRRLKAFLKKKDSVSGKKGISSLKQALNSSYQALKNIISATPLKNMVDKELARADLPLRGEEFLAFAFLGMGVVILGVLVLTGSIMMMVYSALVMLPLPYIFIRHARHKRLSLLNSQIGDALVIIANSLRSGFSFLQAMDLVRKEMPDPIAREFGRTFQEINLGTPTEQALSNMAERVGSEDLDMVVTAVLIQRQVGGNLAEVLDKIAHTIKERIRIKGEIKTLTAQGRISGIVVGLLPVVMALLLFAINPEYVSLLFTTPVGWFMVLGAFVAQATGFFVIKKIVDIKY